ncbi:MAG: thiamine phosphate synthase [Desulfovibrionaceae bacterium]|nr:thiamine phosphate synthase [Desulfovibrionaceae bacterium]
MFYSLMLVTQKGSTPLSEYMDFIRQCADGGITSVQIREKSLSDSELITLGEHIVRTLEPYHIPVVVNDYPHIANTLGTRYIHIGQSDKSVEDVYECIPDAILGLSIEKEEELYKANSQTLAYVSASAVFSTLHKDNLKTIWGLDGLSRLHDITQHPLIAIGGITLETVESVLERGAQGIAVIGALHNVNNPYRVAKQFRTIIDSYV